MRLLDFNKDYSTRNSLANQRKSPDSIVKQLMLDMWRTKWHWDKCYSEKFGFPPSVSSHQCSISYSARLSYWQRR